MSEENPERMVRLLQEIRDNQKLQLELFSRPWR